MADKRKRRQCSGAFLLAMLFAIKATAQPLKITHLTGDYYIFNTWVTLDSGPYPANGMYLVTDKGVALFDSPWDTTQVRPLLDSIQARHHRKVVLCIATHFHEDRTGGLEILSRMGVATYTSLQTLELCRERKKPQPKYYFVNDTTFTLGNYSFSTWHPGAGHSKDNIVLWCDKDKVLYGGCFVKSKETQDIGNIADADLDEWRVSIQKTIDKYHTPSYVIPGHLDWTDNTALLHTRKLVKRAQRAAKHTVKKK